MKKSDADRQTVLVIATLIGFGLFLIVFLTLSPNMRGPRQGTTYDSGFFVALSLFLAIAAFVAIKLWKSYPR